ncbi:MAG: glycosyltransferase, partial [bacterium]
IKKMHEVGVYHKDLNLKNILIQNKENQIEIFIIDFDKACLKKRLTERQRKRNLLRLNRSVEKLEKETPLMTGEDKVVFLNQYYKDKEDKEETIKKTAGFSISKKLTIAHFISLKRRAGVERQFINYITNKSSRFNHIVIGNGINEEYKRYLEKIKIKTIYFKEEVPLIGKSYYLATILKKFQVNCLISYNYLDKAYIPLSLAFFRKKDRPCLVHYELGRGWHRRKRNLSVSLFKLLAKGYFAVSKDSQIMLDNLGIKKEKIRVIYNMFYDMTNTNSKAFSKEETSQVGYLGRLDTIKGVHCLPEVFLTIWEMNSKVRFHLAGDGDLEEWLRNEFHKKGILNKVTFHGNIKDPQEVMKRCSLILIPSLADTFPIIALEAASLKLPVVATSVGGLPEIIEDGLNGFLVFPTIPANIYLKKIEVDLKKTIKGIPKKVLISGRLVSPAFAEPKELAKAAVKILNDPEKAKEMGEKGYQMVQKFSQEVYIRNFEENIFNLFFERDNKC